MTTSGVVADMTTNLNPLDRFETVSLAQLDSRAALQTRTDRKYLIDASNLPSLIDMLPDGVQVLEIDGRQRSSYTSTYFDTPGFDSYLGAARSRPNRFKVRVRTYLDTDVHYLEVKTRNRTGLTSKVRCPAEAEDHDGVDHAGRAFVLDALADKPVGRFEGKLVEAVRSLEPTLSTHYRRTTLLIEPEADRTSIRSTTSRTTIDTSLAFNAPGCQQLHHPGLAIVETKTAGPPSLVDRLLWRIGHRPVRVSKYAVGLALFHPDLPAAKWNRILRREFGWKPKRREARDDSQQAHS